ncbi:MAG: DotU family type IV/VI secretion system protein [Planctomycetes bacterium]|nr:DotU family type IV/VI secretion system protein [Planctomycetota bacterium]
MTLLELVEPILQQVCRLNRLARKGAAIDLTVVRSELRSAINDARARAAAEPEMMRGFETVEPSLLVFIDSSVRGMRAGFAGVWKPLAPERGVDSSVKVVEEAIEKALADNSPGSSERLAVLAELLGLGIPNIYASNREAAAKKLAEILPRLSGLAEIDQTQRVCPEAYRNVDTRKLTLPPVRSLTSVGIAAVGMIVVVVVAYFMLFARASGDLRQTLQQIKESGSAAPAEGGSK